LLVTKARFGGRMRGRQLFMIKVNSQMRPWFPRDRRFESGSLFAACGCRSGATVSGATVIAAFMALLN
jgi:hypothetical protein